MVFAIWATGWLGGGGGGAVVEAEGGGGAKVDIIAFIC